jgi:hypothetical protein
MTRSLLGFHPSFDALSAHADRSDLKAARTRVGVHVSRCAACAQTVAEIHALGEAARDEVLPGAPAGLWARIEAGMRDMDREVSRPIERADQQAIVVAPSVHPTRQRGVMPTSTRARFGLGFLIAAGGGLLAILLASGSRQNLGAAPPSRLTLDRSYVKPGTSVGMRYRPAAALADAQSVTVWAWYQRRDEESTWASWRWGSLVRAGTLRRSSAQEYLGSVVLPVDALVAGYVIGDSLGFVIDRVHGQSATLATALAADVSGKPSFDALVAFLRESRPSANGVLEGAAAAQLAALYPGRPETWILTYPPKQRGVIADIVKLFESRERVYDGWHERLKARQPLSLESELMMAGLANDLMDTARADFWVGRLVREHASSPWVPELWIGRYRDVPRDSISTILAAFEPVWEAARGSRAEALSRALALADRSGDAALRQRWHAREAEANPLWVLDAYSDAWLADSTSRAELGRQIRAQLAKEMRDTLAAPSLWFTAQVATNLKSATRHRLRTRLAAIQLLDGDVRGARHVLDSLAAMPDPLRGECQSPATLRWRAEAELRLGELEAARGDLAYIATSRNWRIAVVGDSARLLLGAAYSPESWAKAKQEAAPRHRSCFIATQARAKQTGG